MQSSDGTLQKSDLKGDYTCHCRSLHLALENTGVPREAMCVLAQNTDTAKRVPVVCGLHTKYTQHISNPTV